MTLSLLENVEEVESRKRQSQEVEDLPCGVKRGKAKDTSRVSSSGESQQCSSPKRRIVDGSTMASARIADYSPSKLLGMASKMADFARSSSLTRSSVDAKADEAVPEICANGDLSKEEELCARHTVPQVPDTWPGDSFLPTTEWDTSSVSCLPMPLSLGCNSDRLQHHRVQVAGHVVIPDSWPGEQNLMDWIDTEPLQEALTPLGLMMARAALIDDHSSGRGQV